MKIITGVGEAEHVTSDEHRALFGSILGQGTYILNYGENLDAELVTNTRIKAKSGMMMHKTNVSYVKAYDEIDLQPGTQGMKRIDLVVNRYEKIKETGVEKNTWVAIMGVPVAEEPVTPAYIVGDILNGDLIDDCPVYEVEFDGINIVEIRKILTVVSDDISGLMKQVKNLESQKQDNISGAASTITENNLTKERVVITDANGKITISSITKAVLEFLSGVTSNIQTQLNGKSATHSHPYVNTANIVNNLTTTVAGYVLDGRIGKTISDKITSLTNTVNSLNSNINRLTKLHSGNASNYNHSLTLSDDAFNYKELIVIISEDNNYAGIGIVCPVVDGNVRGGSGAITCHTVCVNITSYTQSSRLLKLNTVKWLDADNNSSLAISAIYGRN